MALTFALLFNPRVLGGLTFHETAGVAIGAAVFTHILLNYRWVKNTTLKIFDQKLPGKARFSYLLNLLLLISMSAIIVTGILISRVLFPNFSVGENHMIRGLHNLSSNITLALVGIHVGVHWQWVMNVFKKMFKLKGKKTRKGVIITAIVAIVILIGGYQVYNAKFATRPVAINSQQFEQFKSGTSSDQRFNGDRNNAVQGPSNGALADRHGHGGDFRGHGGGQNPFSVIISYFGIMAVIIIPTYYLEKQMLRKKRKLKEGHKHNLVES
jgi:cytochrome b561